MSTRYTTSFSTERERLLVPTTTTDTDHDTWFMLKICSPFSEVYLEPYRVSMMSVFEERGNGF